MEPIILLHGYSAESATDDALDVQKIFGNLPTDLRTLRATLGQKGSFLDKIRPELRRRLEAVLGQNLQTLLLNASLEELGETPVLGCQCQPLCFPGRRREVDWTISAWRLTACCTRRNSSRC